VGLRRVFLASGLASAGQTFCTDCVLASRFADCLLPLPSPSSASIRRFQGLCYFMPGRRDSRRRDSKRIRKWPLVLAFAYLTSHGPCSKWQQIYLVKISQNSSCYTEILNYLPTTFIQTANEFTFIYFRMNVNSTVVNRTKSHYKIVSKFSGVVPCCKHQLTSLNNVTLLGFAAECRSRSNRSISPNHRAYSIITKINSTVKSVSGGAFQFGQKSFDSIVFDSRYQIDFIRFDSAIW